MVRLEDEVKESVVDFLGKVQTNILDEICFPSSLNHLTIKNVVLPTSTLRMLPYVSNRIVIYM